MATSKNFVLIGAAGYIAPRHMEAIKLTGNNLIAALDKNDSVGILDTYFPECDFFTEFERFDRHCEKLKLQGTLIHYVVVCSPNYLHDAHIRFGLRLGADVICEKPVVLNPWNIDALQAIEQQTNHKVNCILQLRLHPEIIKLKEQILNTPKDIIHQVTLDYVTPRGNWYAHSWKGDVSKSGGVVTNIGIHLFDVLIWIFGEVISYTVTTLNNKTAKGTLKLQQAHVSWLLSIDDEVRSIMHNESKSYRKMMVNDSVYSFDKVFTELHTNSYAHIIDGKGYGLAHAKPAIELVHQIRLAKL